MVSPLPLHPPTRQSVAVVQGITNSIIDVRTAITIRTMMDNSLFAVRAGQAAEFVSMERAILTLMKAANLRAARSLQ